MADGAVDTLTPSKGGSETNAFDFIKQSVVQDNLLGTGLSCASFALNGFNDPELDKKYALRIRLNYVPKSAMPEDRDGNPHAPLMGLDDLLKRTTCLTPPNQIYAGHKVSQTLLRDLERDDDLGIPNISIVPRHSGHTLANIILAEADQFYDGGGAKAFKEAHIKATHSVLDQIEANPRAMIDLFKQAAELGWNGVSINHDMHMENIFVEHDGSFSMVDVFSDSDTEHLCQPQDAERAQINMNALHHGINYHFACLLDPNGLPEVMNERASYVLDQCMQQAEEELQLPEKEQVNDGRHSPAFTFISETGANPTRIDQHSTVKDLLGALDKLHGAIGAGRGV
ncbi:MAG: hypothetical protein MRY32_03695 [Rickettsiales bacterium]|nr:hypothetical protein [Rickettsiales bacterium]